MDSIPRVLGRILALIPLMVYGLGTLVEVYVRGSGILYRDGLMPYEIIGLSACATYLVVDSLRR